MAVLLSPVGGVAGQFFDNNGAPLSGGKMYTYVAGTTTPQATYTSAAGSTAHSNPIILDSGGRVPGGEIWLTDGLQYKFVLKTSTDVLIGTYDNIVGINSNFVNFLTETEVQTATSGQTVFTLATTTYQPGTNTLSVFVDGVNQYDGITYAYVETSSTVVTFTAGLHVGALVKFTTAQTLSSGVTDASIVTYQPAGTGAVATTVQTKLRESVSVKDFGAPTNGTDATAAINTAILAAQTLKANQLSYDEIYEVEVIFEQGKDYSVIGPILIPSGIILNGNGCRLVGNIPAASTAAYSDALPSLIETAYYNGTTITTNRAAALNTERLVGSTITGFAFTNANCAINAIQMNERCVISNCTISNVSAALRTKNCYYLEVNGVRITGSSAAVNQYAISLYGGNANAMKFTRVTIGSGASVGMAISGPANAGTSIRMCSFEGSASGTGIYFGADAYCLGFDISNNYFEGVQYGVVTEAGAGIYGAAIDANFFSSCEYAILATASAFRVSSFRGNAISDGGGVIRNLVDIAASGNDFRYQIQSKSANTTTGPSAPPSNILPSNQSVAESTSSWTRIASPFDAIGRAQPGLFNQSKLNELPFEGANIVTVVNEPPFVSLVKTVNTLTINTLLTYDTSNILVFNFYGNTDSVNWDLKGFIFGTTVSWVTHDPVGVTLTVNNNSGFVQLVFGNLTAAIPVINVAGCVRHV